jgi:hypothetical protein
MPHGEFVSADWTRASPATAWLPGRSNPAESSPARAGMPVEARKEPIVFDGELFISYLSLSLASVAETNAFYSRSDRNPARSNGESTLSLFCAPAPQEPRGQLHDHRLQDLPGRKWEWSPERRSCLWLNPETLPPPLLGSMESWFEVTRLLNRGCHPPNNLIQITASRPWLQSQFPRAGIYR